MSRNQFYKTKAWHDMRIYVWLKQSCLCARCHKPVYVDGLSEWLPKDQRVKSIVHHKEYLNESNYMDDNVALNEDNLEGLCIDCHNREHFGTGVVRNELKFDEYGNLVPR